MGGELCTHMRDNVIGIGHNIGLRDNHGMHAFAPTGVRKLNDGTLRHRRMARRRSVSLVPCIE